MQLNSKPDCYKCKYKNNIPGDAHIRCSNKAAVVEGNLYGYQRGWFKWPHNFDPVWLKSCNGFESKPTGGES